MTIAFAARGYNPIMPFAPKTSPTLETYLELQRAYDHFNAELFDGGLPFCLINPAERHGHPGLLQCRAPRPTHRRDK